MQKKKNRCLREKVQLRRQQRTIKNASKTILDNINQDLCFVNINLYASGEVQPPAAREKIESSKKYLSKAITELRQLGNELNNAATGDIDF
jgi:signal transduction histidine kinase